MKTYLISAYTLWGAQFGTTVEAENVDEMFRIFHEENKDSEIADYWFDEEE